MANVIYPGNFKSPHGTGTRTSVAGTTPYAKRQFLAGATLANKQYIDRRLKHLSMVFFSVISFTCAAGHLIDCRDIVPAINWGLAVSVYHQPIFDLGTYNKLNMIATHWIKKCEGASQWYHLPKSKRRPFFNVSLLHNKSCDDCGLVERLGRVAEHRNYLPHLIAKWFKLSDYCGMEYTTRRGVLRCIPQV